LEEVELADLLIHVVDLSHPQYLEQIEAVEKILGELGAAHKETLLVFNKIDQLPHPALIETQLARFPGSVAISALKGHGMEEFIAALQNRLAADYTRGCYALPPSESALLAKIYRTGHVTSLNYHEGISIVHATVPPELARQLEPFSRVRKEDID
jgi:GTP-binding protein HflX